MARSNIQKRRAKKHKTKPIQTTQISPPILSQKAYTLQLERQHNKCKICKTKQKDDSPKLTVDYDHKYGKVRSLICPSCSIALNRIEDHPQFLDKVREYLAVHDKRPKIFIDLDNTLANFDGSKHLIDWDGVSRPFGMYNENFFDSLTPLPGAIKNVYRLIESGKYSVHILTKPLANSPKSYEEKVTWILKYLSPLRDKIIMTQNKLLISDQNAILIDDDLEWESFKGKFIHFDITKSSEAQWEWIVDELLREEL